MSKISIIRTHEFTQKQAMQAADSVAAQFKTKYGVQARWQGEDTLNLERAGTRGKFHLTARVIRLELKLGFMLAAFREPIERELERILDEHLTAKSNQATPR